MFKNFKKMKMYIVNHCMILVKKPLKPCCEPIVIDDGTRSMKWSIIVVDWMYLSGTRVENADL